MKILDFLNVLALVTVFCGIVTFVNWLFTRRQSTSNTEKQNIIIEYARSFFPILLIVVGIRSFVFQPYRVPTGSLEPTVMPGDLIFVTQFNYGLTLPVWDFKLVNVGTPQRGQIALFRWPVNPKITFVKRVIGVPGDRVSYINKVFYINGKMMKQTYVSSFSEVIENGKTRPVKRYLEDLDGLKHYVIRNPNQPANDFKNLVIPPNQYLMIGDNRDDSDDSRSWGFVPLKSFLGRAEFVWFNITFEPFSVGWDRIGTRLFGSVANTTKDERNPL